MTRLPCTYKNLLIVALRLCKDVRARGMIMQALKTYRGQQYSYSYCGIVKGSRQADLVGDLPMKEIRTAMRACSITVHAPYHKYRDSYNNSYVHINRTKRYIGAPGNRYNAQHFKPNLTVSVGSYRNSIYKLSWSQLSRYLLPVRIEHAYVTKCNPIYKDLLNRIMAAEGKRKDRDYKDGINVSLVRFTDDMAEGEHLDPLTDILYDAY